MASSREWISISDLMSVLMMVFLFIAILFMVQVQQDSKEITEQHATMRSVAETYEEARHGLRDALRNTFADDLAGWNAEVLADGTVRFNDPAVLFEVGSSRLKARFRTILDKFFPRYLKLLASSDWRDEVEEIRIEGHTSSDWVGGAVTQQRYLKNAKLSQERAFAVLQYVYEYTGLDSGERVWLRKVLRATGVSFARPVLSDDGSEDVRRSRRVEFHAKLKADDKLAEIVKQVSR